MLKKNDATATFVVGEMVAQHKDLIARIHEAGHAIGNHIWDHANLTTLSDAAIRDELRRTAKVVGSGDGACARPTARPQ